MREGRRDETKTESEKGVEGKRTKGRMRERERRQKPTGRKVIVEGKLLLEELSDEGRKKSEEERRERTVGLRGNMDEYTES